MQTRRISRREVLVGGTAVALAAAVPGRSAAQAKELVANTYGGGWEAGHRAAIAQALEKRGIKVTLVSMLAAELVARTKAAAGGRPPVDVALVDDGPFLLAVKEGVFQQLPMDRIPNAKRVYAKYRPKEPFGVPSGASQIGIAGLAWLAITKGANTEIALEYLNQGLDPDSQKLMAGAPSYIGPVIEGVEVAPELRGIVPATPADLERLKTLDWPKINEQRADWIARWNREIKV